MIKLNRINQFIHKTKQSLYAHPKLRAWVWFIILWLGGLLFVLSLSYSVKGFFFLSRLI